MVIAANLKTNLTRVKTKEYLDKLEVFLKEHNISQDVFVFPSASSLNLHVGIVHVGAQNAYAAQNGAYTGEIGNEHLQEFGINTILIGHSERRHIIGESQDVIAGKFDFYKELGFEIIYCVGEPLEIREKGFNDMMEYISDQYEGIDTSYEKLIIAYEPVWAIGTGLTPTMRDIETVHEELKKISKAPLLYGGSVKLANTKEILELKNVDGILVGSAALKVEDFCKMCEIAQSIDK